MAKKQNDRSWKAPRAAGKTKGKPAIQPIRGGEEKPGAKKSLISAQQRPKR